MWQRLIWEARCSVSLSSGLNLNACHLIGRPLWNSTGEFLTCGGVPINIPSTILGNSGEPLSLCRLRDNEARTLHLSILKGRRTSHFPNRLQGLIKRRTTCDCLLRRNRRAVGQRWDCLGVGHVVPSPSHPEDLGYRPARQQALDHWRNI
ncbi:hypothetical protein AX14_002020 [Amanita brunnescens Koide BX004]|nr:hypothetical protein AX14_002020 [Amanita brunnescens Koide BX004]